MPEGDTVFLTAHRLRNALVDKPLTRAEIRHPRLATVDLVGRSVNDVRSVGKHLFVRFTGELSLHHHLRMDGVWQVLRPGGRWRYPAHQARVVLGHDGGGAVGFRLHDLRLLAVADEHKLVGHLGPDLLDPEWTDEHADRAEAALLAEPGRQLGAALLDQRVMAGVGNLYATEVCFLLGRTPWTPVSELPAGQARQAVSLCRKLLCANALRHDQSTTGQLARGRRHWVYERGRHGCFRCGGRVRRAEHAESPTMRVAYYCPNCQAGPGPD